MRRCASIPVGISTFHSFNISKYAGKIYRKLSVTIQL
jgi:hypothetical protein